MGTCEYCDQEADCMIMWCGKSVCLDCLYDNKELAELYAGYVKGIIDAKETIGFSPID
jgi:hypothetical protein